MHELSDILVRSPVSLSLCTDGKEFNRGLRAIGRTDYPNEWLSEGASACMHTMRDLNGRIWCVVCMPRDRKASHITTHTKLAHEAMHVVQEILNQFGEERPGREFEAYMLENVCGALFHSYASAIKKKA